MTEETNEVKKAQQQEQQVEVAEADIIEDATVAEQKSLGQRLTTPERWLRLVFMLLFGIISGVAGYIITAVVVINFVWGLVTGEGNDKLRDFGSSLSQYIYQILRFLTYNTEDKPFPFSDWPESEQQEK